MNNNSPQIIRDEQGVAFCIHKITFPEYKGKFSVWIDTLTHKIFDAEQINDKGRASQVFPNRHHVLMAKLQKKVNYLLATTKN